MATLEYTFMNTNPAITNVSKRQDEGEGFGADPVLNPDTEMMCT